MERRLDGITFEGIPLKTMLDAVHAKESSDEFRAEAGRYRGAIRRGGGKVRMEMEHNYEHGAPRVLGEEERFGVMAAKSGKVKLDEWLRFPSDTKGKVIRLFKCMQMVPDKFATSEVSEQIKAELKVSDYQRVLLMLNQGGFLDRTMDFGNRIIHTKTEYAKGLSETDLATELVLKNQEMTGFVPNRRIKRKEKEVIRARVGEVMASKKKDREPQEPQEPQENNSYEGRDSFPVYPPDAMDALAKHEAKKVVPGSPIISGPFIPPTPGTEKWEAIEMKMQPSVSTEKLIEMEQNKRIEAATKRMMERREENGIGLIDGLEPRDAAMVTELVKSLKGIRKIFPGMSRRDFLITFMKGGKEVD